MDYLVSWNLAHIVNGEVMKKYADRLVRLGPKPALPTAAVAEGKATYGKRKDHNVGSG